MKAKKNDVAQPIMTRILQQQNEPMTNDVLKRSENTNDAFEQRENANDQ